MSAVGTRVREIRKQKRISQKYLADVLNIGQGTVSRYESGELKLVADFLPELAGALGCSPCDFFTTDPVEQPPPTQMAPPPQDVAPRPMSTPELALTAMRNVSARHPQPLSTEEVDQLDQQLRDVIARLRAAAST
jgi:transcriptional regulator with XRE-family HTH domain